MYQPFATALSAPRSAMKLAHNLRRSLLFVALSVGFGATATGCDTISSWLISSEQEVELGEGVDDQIHLEYEIVDAEDPTAKWADDLVQNMVESANEYRNASEFGGYKVHVIYDNELVNAFAAPGGFIYIASGLVLAAESCGQVAGVVGHELAHVTQRHSVKRLAQSSAALGLSDILFEEGLTKSVIDGVYTFLVNTTFSRRDETEADKVGTAIMHASGYNPYALADMFAMLAELSAGREPPRFLSSHPLSSDRVEAIHTQIEETWGDSIQPEGDETYVKSCIGTSLSFEEVRKFFEDGDVEIVPDTGEQPPTEPDAP